jgi:D-alanine-D-alanine ligase
MTCHVAVLMGGWSAEREVSLVSGANVSEALKSAGYRVTLIDVQRDAGSLLTRLNPRPDCVFNALHGRYGEDGCIQGFLNILEIPYTHSGLLASALAMDKPMAKTLFRAAGLTVPDHLLARRDDVINRDVLPRPYVIKPLNEGSSVGVRIVREGDNLRPLAGAGWIYGSQVMVEPYIAGRELTVAAMGDRALAVTEITSHRGFYDYEAKYSQGGSGHMVPAQVNAGTYEKAMATAIAAHRTLGCRGVSRADFRFDGNDLYLLEINTQPGMTPTSLVPEQAAHIGISYHELVIWMVENAEFDA